MAEQLPQEQTVTLEELVVSHSYEMIALITELERKGILNRTEIIEVIYELKVFRLSRNWTFRPLDLMVSQLPLNA